MHYVVFAALIAGVALGHAGEPLEPNPCSLLSSAEIGAATGVAVTEGTIAIHNGSTTSCSFARRGGGRIAVFIRRPGAAWAADQVDRMRRGVGLGSYREVGAVGERAFLLDRNAAGAVLCVFQHPYYLQLSIVGAGDPPQRPAILEKLARTALRRLTSRTAAGELAAVGRQ